MKWRRLVVLSVATVVIGVGLDWIVPALYLEWQWNHMSAELTAAAAQKARSQPPAAPVPAPVPPAAPPQAVSLRGGQIHGQVVGPAGEPVAGALVRVLEPVGEVDPPGATVSDRDGNFILADPARHEPFGPAPYVPRLVATADGFGPGWSPALQPTSPLVLALVPPGPALRGRIIDDEHQPVAGALVRVVDLYARVNRHDWAEAGTLAAAPGASLILEQFQALPCGLMASTDREGWFEIGGLGPERLVVIRVQGPAIATTRIETTTSTQTAPLLVRTEAGQSRVVAWRPNAAEVVIGGSQTIEGTITEASTGRPLPGWTIQGLDARESRWTQPSPDIATRSDAAGRYRLDGLPRVLAYRVFLAPPPGEPYLPAGFDQVSAAGDGGPIRVDLATHRAVRVRGKVTDRETGAPIFGMVRGGGFASNRFVDAFPGYRASRLVAHRTDAQGEFEAVVPPGPGVVGFTPDGAGHAANPGVEAIPGFVPPVISPISGSYPTVGEPLHPCHAMAAVDPPVESGSVRLDFDLIPFHTVVVDLVGPDHQPAVGGFMVAGDDLAIGPVVHYHDRSSLVVRRLLKGEPRRVDVWQVARKLVGSMAIDGDEDKRITLSLRPWGEVRGRIVRDDGSPSPDLQLHQEMFPNRDDPLISQQSLVQVARLSGSPKPAGPGEFHLIGLVPGQTYRAAAAGKDRIAIGDLFDDVTVRPGEVKDLGDLKVRPYPPRPGQKP